MHAAARQMHPSERPVAPVRPRLRAVPASRRRRLPSAATLALYALGLVTGFLLAAIASAPGGGSIVATQLQLALAAMAICGVALMRSRAVARRRDGRRTRTAGL